MSVSVTCEFTQDCWNILISGKIIKEIPGSVASGTLCIIFLQLLLSFQSSSINLFSPISSLIPSAQLRLGLPRFLLPGGCRFITSFGNMLDAYPYPNPIPVYTVSLFFARLGVAGAKTSLLHSVRWHRPRRNVQRRTKNTPCLNTQDSMDLE